jgi:DNA-binding GntR family transcriptional regulator
MHVADLPQATVDSPPATAERIADVLRQRMVEGVLPPGMPLREATIASQLGVSRNTLREALRLLVASGLVEVRLYRGAVVKALTPGELRDIYRVRRILELQAVEESAIATQDAIDRVGAAVRRAEEAVAEQAWKQVGTASLRFHQALVGLLGSHRVDSFFQNIVAQLRLAFAQTATDEAFQPPWVPRDRLIFELLRTGRRTEARSELRAYLEDSERAVLDLLRGGYAGGARSGDVEQGRG